LGVFRDGGKGQETVTYIPWPRPGLSMAGKAYPNEQQSQHGTVLPELSLKLVNARLKEEEFVRARLAVRLGTKGSQTMPKITASPTHQTVITTFEMTPGTCHDLLEALTDAYRNFISKQPGFIAAGLHVNDAQTRIANYSQWERREDFQAMLRSDEMRRRNRDIHAMCRSFEPVMYDVVGTFD